MDILEAIKSRHSVRSFTDKKIEGQVKIELKEAVEEVNEESGLNIQLCLNEVNAFDSLMAHYGRFKNCKNYIALVGPKTMDEKIGYYGEKLLIKAQQLGINSCWVGLTYSKSKTSCFINKGEKLHLVIALGYGVTQGSPRKSKGMMEVCKVEGEMPAWFENGVKAALLAPTAVNQQKFHLALKGGIVTAKALSAFYSKVDLGIVKYHFEVGAGKSNFQWG